MIGRAAAIGCLALLPLGAMAAEPSTPRETVLAAVHVHSLFSTGTDTLDELAVHAEQLGLDALVLSENLVLHYEYGLFPLRGVLRRQVTFPSVMETGLSAYLAEVSRVQAAHPRVILVPGVEVAPHYYWSGSLLDDTLTMHNSQKNLLVLGLTRAEDYLALPVSGLPSFRTYTLESAVSLLPLLLLGIAVWLWRLGGSMPIVTDGISHRFRTLSWLVSGISLVLLVNAWPFTRPAFSLYEPSDYRPYQRLIDTASALGGLVIWSLPEPRDFHQYEFRPLGRITVVTEPYPEALILTHGYTAFGAVYQDTRRAIEPGGVWDQAISLYLNGERPIPPFMTAESAFHGSSSDGKELDAVLSVLRVRERSLAGLLEAFRAGRLYGTSRFQSFGLRLDRFRVEIDGGQRGAESGETLDPEGSRDLAVRVAVSSTDPQPHEVTVRIIRSGQVIGQSKGTTPFEMLMPDEAVPAGQWHAYRVLVDGPGEIVSNPVFVGPVPP